MYRRKVTCGAERFNGKGEKKSSKMRAGKRGGGRADQKFFCLRDRRGGQISRGKTRGDTPSQRELTHGRYEKENICPHSERKGNTW